MSNFIAYTQNEDGSVNVLAGSNSRDILARILPAGTSYNVHNGEVYKAGGKTWLSAKNADYLKAQAQDEKEKALAKLDAQYEADKKELISAYADALLNGDTEAQESCQADMATLNEQYDNDYNAILEGE